MVARLVVLVLVAGCSTPPTEIVDDHAGHPHPVLLEGEALAARVTAGVAQFDAVEPFRHAGLRLDGEVAGARFSALVDGTWTPAAPLPLTWSEGRMHVARVLLDRPATALRLSGVAGLTGLVLETWATPQVDRERPLARQLPFARGLEVRHDRMAPRDLVIPREEWGARNPGQICNDVEDPYRISVHHTASPSDDGGDAAIRMRQMQAFHMDNRGWCDIGYHFVVSQAGQVYEGRRGEDRPAAHVANQNAGNVGISFIGDYTQQQVNANQFAAGAAILGWIATTHDIPWDRDVIRGHQEWPGQQTSCPGGNLLNRLEELIELASDGDVEPPPPPTGEVDVRYDTYWLLEAVIDDHLQGTSAGVPDAFPGDRIQVALEIANDHDAPLRGVELGFAFDDGLTPVDYTIYTDHPARDGQTWMVNDADAAPENPPKDAMGQRGTLTMYAFGAGETKRVVVTLAIEAYAGRYRPQVLGWVRHIDEVYDQANYEAAPSVDEVGVRLAAFEEIDLLSREEWTFPAPLDPLDLEGWTPCGPDLVNDDGAMAVAADGCALSPEWTGVDADRWDSLVLRLARPADGGRVALWWLGGGEGFNRARSVTFEAFGDELVVDLAGRSGWSGIVERLRLTLAGESLSIDGIHPQSRERAESGSRVYGFSEEPPVVVLDDEEPPAPREDAGVRRDAGRVDPPPPPPARDWGVDPDGSAPAQDGGGEEGGCVASPGGGGAWLLILALVGLRRRR